MEFAYRVRDKGVEENLEVLRKRLSGLPLVWVEHGTYEYVDIAIMG